MIYDYEIRIKKETSIPVGARMTKENCKYHWSGKSFDWNALINYIIDFIDENGIMPNISIGLAEDWFHTANGLIRNGKFNEDFKSTNRSCWATPVFVNELTDEIIPCWTLSHQTNYNDRYGRCPKSIVIMLKILGEQF